VTIDNDCLYKKLSYRKEAAHQRHVRGTVPSAHYHFTPRCNVNQRNYLFSYFVYGSYAVSSYVHLGNVCYMLNYLVTR